MFPLYYTIPPERKLGVASSWGKEKGDNVHHEPSFWWPCAADIYAGANFLIR
jgi:hypothetical protein